MTLKPKLKKKIRIKKTNKLEIYKTRWQQKRLEKKTIGHYILVF